MYETIAPTDKRHWLELRAGNINSTEVSALFGANEYLTLFELWHRKKSKDLGEIEENRFMKWGTRLQDSIAAGIAHDEGFQISRFDGYVHDPEHKIGSSFDFFIGDDGILEIKNVSEKAFREKWKVDGEHIEAPLYIEAQVQHQLLLSGRKYTMIGALVGGNQVRLVKRLPDPKVHAAIHKNATSFWSSIEKSEPPAPSFEKDAEFIRQLYSFAEPGKQMDPDAEITQWAASYHAIGLVIKESEEKRKALKAKMLMKLGDAEKCRGEGWSISAGMIGPAHVEYDRKGYRDFRVNVKGEKE